MAIIDFKLDEHVAIMNWNSGENRFNPDFLKAFFDVMDEIENNTEATVLIVQSGHEKIWSNGLDLDWLMKMIKEKETERVKAFFYDLNKFFKRILMSPLITIACINGHAFAGGAITACAFDFRFMRTDRGYFCFPEVDLGIPFLPGMMALLKKAMPAPALQEMSLTARRMTAGQCVEAGIMMDAWHLDELLDNTLAFAKTQNKRRVVVFAIKETLYGNMVKVFDEEDPPLIESGRLNI